MGRCIAKITHLWSVLWITCISFEPYDSFSSQMCPAVKKSIDSYWGVSVFPSPVLICSVTSDRTTFLLGSHLDCKTVCSNSPKSAVAILSVGEQSLLSTKQQQQQVRDIFLLWPSCPCPPWPMVFWRAPWDPQGSIMQPRSELWCMLCSDTPFPCQAGETMSKFCQHKTCYRANQDLCLYYHCKLEPNV